MDFLDEAKLMVHKSRGYDNVPSWASVVAQQATAYALIALVERMDRLTATVAALRELAWEE